MINEHCELMLSVEEADPRESKRFRNTSQSKHAYVIILKYPRSIISTITSQASAHYV